VSIDKILSVAKTEVGEHEEYSGGHWVNDSKYTRWYGRIPGYGQDGYGYPWCAVFVTWCAHEAGSASLYPKTAGCATAVNWFKNKGRFSEYPAVGAQVFFGHGGGTHTGVVYAYDADYVYTYEGNTNTNGSAEGDGVYARKRARRDAYLYGYGYPAVTGSLSADPDAEKFGYKAAKTGETKPAKPPVKPKLEPFPGAAFFLKSGKPALGKSSPIFTAMGKRLVAEGFGRFYSEGPGPKLGRADVNAYEAFQRSLGYTGADAEWAPGATSWAKLKVPNV